MPAEKSGQAQTELLDNNRDSPKRGQVSEDFNLQIEFREGKSE